MWIRNTSRHSEAEVDRLVGFASQEIDMTNVCINVRNGALAGGAYNGVPEISNAPAEAEYLITLRIGTGREQWPLGPVNYHFKSPDEVGPRNRFPFYVCSDWREWLVKLAAHESHHIEQFREKAICSEIECEKFSIRMLERFRDGREPIVAPGAPRARRPRGAPREAPISIRARRSGWDDDLDQRPKPDPPPESKPDRDQVDDQIALF
jgi:hypothetical protein